MSSTIHFWFVVTVAFAGISNNGTNVTTDDRNELEGTWELLSYENEGIRKLASDHQTSFHLQKIRIKGEKWIEWYDGKSDPPKGSEDDTLFRYSAKPGMPFRNFDYWPVDSNQKPDTWKKVGIYKLDGDRLVICFRVQQIPGKSVKRPREFDASKGKGTGLAIYKRCKPK